MEFSKIRFSSGGLNFKKMTQNTSWKIYWTSRIIKIWPYSSLPWDDKLVLYWLILVENEYLAINHPIHLIVDVVEVTYDHTPYRHFCDTFHHKMIVDSFRRLFSDLIHKKYFTLNTLIKRSKFETFKVSKWP